ncbi:sugar ABC transporter permease, partial [Vibrio vulnificus]|nr:sugar ABC transporter permease [Vibrio vulnificus]
VNSGWPLPLALAAAIGAGAAIGWLYAQLVTRLGVPSFVATLAGLLSFLGLQLYLLGSTGAINLPYDSGPVHFAQLAFVPEWLSYLLVVAAALALFGAGHGLARTRRAAGLSARSTPLLVARSAAVLVGGVLAVRYLNQGRGVGWMVVAFVALVLVLNYALTRTAWGRSV